MQHVRFKNVYIFFTVLHKSLKFAWSKNGNLEGKLFEIPIWSKRFSLTYVMLK